MKLSELKPCAACGGSLPPLWHVVRTSMAMFKPGAMRDTMALVEKFGGLRNPGALAVAEIMSPDPECITILGDEKPELMIEFNLCQRCFLKGSMDIALLAECAQKKTEPPVEEAAEAAQHFSEGE